MRVSGVVSVAITLSLLVSGGFGGQRAAGGVAERERSFVRGSVLSYAWLLGDKPVHKGDLKGAALSSRLYGDRIGGRRHVRDDVGMLRVSDDDFSVWGASHDAVLEVGLRSKLDSYEGVCGANFSLMVPGGTGGSIVGYGRGAVGSRVYFDTAYGSLSMGYQEGVESTLKVDVLDSLPGVAGGSWGRHVMRFLKYSYGVPFHVQPGLYSENLFRSMAWRDASKDPFSVRFRDVVTTIPLRLSYVSRSVNGFQFGVSYAVAGYRDDLFKGGDFKVSDVISEIHSYEDTPAVPGKNVSVAKTISLDKPRFDFGPVYKNLVSAALRYELFVENARVAFSLAVEHGDAKKHGKLSMYPSHSRFFVEYDELAAYSVGMEALYAGVLKVGLSYGYLGKSGRPKVFTGIDNVVRHVPYLEYKPSYYFASSIGYLHGPFSASAMCFVSRVGYNSPVAAGSELLSGLGINSVFESLFDGENILTDFVLGFGYDMYRKGKANVQMFMSYHVFSLFQRYNVHRRTLSDAAGYKRAKAFEHISSHKNAYEGIVAFGGLKFTF